jgi:uncharacterized protein (DUF362 family)
MQNGITRRRVLTSLGAAAAGLGLTDRSRGAEAAAPTAPVAIGKCKTYQPAELVATLDTMFDRLGGLGRIVKGKTVAIKLNFNGGSTARLGHLPLGDSHWPHPNLVCATMHLMAKAGVRRVRLVECAPIPWTEPFEEYFIEANWNPQDFINSAPRVEFENTNYTGAAKKFSRIQVPGGGLLFPAYDVNYSYVDCDTFVTIAKSKDHPTTGVSIVLKNSFGLTPLMAYGNHAGKWEENDLVAGTDRIFVLHMGKSQPAYGALPEIDPKSPRDDGYRVPRIIADLIAAKPPQLAIVDAVKTMAGSQTPDPWCTPVEPGTIIAGTNAVNTSAVAVAAMNYDPRAPKGTAPFERCDNKLLLAEQLGVGTCDLKRIEVVGPSIQSVTYDFRALREKRKKTMGDYASYRKAI